MSLTISFSSPSLYTYDLVGNLPFTGEASGRRRSRRLLRWSNTVNQKTFYTNPSLFFILIPNPKIISPNSLSCGGIGNYIIETSTITLRSNLAATNSFLLEINKKPAIVINNAAPPTSLISVVANQQKQQKRKKKKLCTGSDTNPKGVDMKTYLSEQLRRLFRLENKERKPEVLLMMKNFAESMKIKIDLVMKMNPAKTRK